MVANSAVITYDVGDMLFGSLRLPDKVIPQICQIRPRYGAAEIAQI